jgi:hypothetical protein
MKAREIASVLIVGGAAFLSVPALAADTPLTGTVCAMSSGHNGTETSDYWKARCAAIAEQPATPSPQPTPVLSADQQSKLAYQQHLKTVNDDARQQLLADQTACWDWCIRQPQH